MLIIGAKGFAKEILEVCHQNKDLKHLCFYDDVNDDVNGKLFGKFPVLKSEEEAKEYFSECDIRFTIGIGKPFYRKQLYKKNLKLGGLFMSTIAPTAIIGHYGNKIGEGCNIMQKVIITNDVKIGMGVIVNQLASIGHDVEIGDFTEICPNVSVSGNCKIGANVFIGTGAVVLPGISIGNNAIIGAGSVVTKSLPENCTAVGLPAKIIKQQ
ncbi:MAG TPA: acetyltransferase [Arachidicoccus soli]|nr:acetyltransferase [Arachidicoccus soli]